MADPRLSAAARAMVALNEGDQVLWAELEQDAQTIEPTWDIEGDVDNAPTCECCDLLCMAHDVYDAARRGEVGFAISVHTVRFEGTVTCDSTYRICDDCFESWQALIAEDGIQGAERTVVDLEPPVAFDSAAVSPIETAVASLKSELSLAALEERLDAWADRNGGCVTVDAECELRAIRGMVKALIRASEKSRAA